MVVVMVVGAPGLSGCGLDVELGLGGGRASRVRQGPSVVNPCGQLHNRLATGVIEHRLVALPLRRTSVECGGQILGGGGEGGTWASLPSGYASDLGD